MNAWSTLPFSHQNGASLGNSSSSRSGTVDLATDPDDVHALSPVGLGWQAGAASDHAVNQARQWEEAAPGTGMLAGVVNSIPTQLSGAFGSLAGMTAADTALVTQLSDRLPEYTAPETAIGAARLTNPVSVAEREAQLDQSASHTAIGTPEAERNEVPPTVSTTLSATVLEAAAPNYQKPAGVAANAAQIEPVGQADAPSNEEQPVQSAEVPKTAPLYTPTDRQAIPTQVVDSLLADGLATKTSDGKYVVVHDVAKGNIVDFLLEQYQPNNFEVIDGSGRSTRAIGSNLGPPVYRIVWERVSSPVDAHRSEGEGVGDVLARGRTTTYADLYESQYQAKQLAGGLASQETALNIAEHAVVFAVKMTPIVGTAYSVINEGTEEAVISAAGDVAFFLTFGASKVATAGNASRELIIAAKWANRAAALIEGGIATASIKDGIDELNSGNTLGAAAHFGEATLRLFGVSKSVFDDLRIKAAAPSNLGRGLNILNPQFVPKAESVLQNLTNQVNRELAANPRLASTVLSRAELDASVNPFIARANYGKAVEKLVARRINSDPTLKGLFEHVGGPNNPDFIGKGIYEGMNFDITTPGQVGAHLARPGYGPGLNIITYERPAWAP